MGITTTNPDHEDRVAAGEACYQAALQYRSLGLSPLILCDPDHVGVVHINKNHGTRCNSPGKAPVITWKAFQDRLATEQEMTGWWKQYPIGNVGVVCGQGSGLVRIDADGEAGEALLHEWSQGDLPKTWMFQTPVSGPQRLYAWPRTLPCKSTSKTAEGDHNELRLMGNGEQTVMPPSRHPDGGPYAWVEGHSPDDIPPEKAPVWLLERLRADNKVTTNAAVWLPDDLPEVNLATLNVSDDIRRLILDGVPDGEDRSAPLFKVLQALVTAGCDNNIMAAVALHPDHGISRKPREKGTHWLAQEIERVRAKHDDGTRLIVKTPQPTVVQITVDIPAVVDAGEAAIMALPDGPIVFQRAGSLCRIVQGGKPPKWLRRSPDAPVIRDLTKARVRELAIRAAGFHKYDKRRKRWESAVPPGWFAETLLERGEWSFPLLEGIITAPTLRPDGSLLDAPGYDDLTGLYYLSDGTVFPDMPARPIIDDARTAIGVLKEVFCDFPFEKPEHASTAYAAVMVLCARYAYQGNTPLTAVRSTTRGSGKTLLVDAMTTISNMTTAARWAQTTDEEEERKRLMAVALAGDIAVCIDNITHPFGSGPLD
ncbi:MAG: bifunctional DNA primase/polymerase, partial [Candidatus Tectomicrobia bacterium]